MFIAHGSVTSNEIVERKTGTIFWLRNYESFCNFMEVFPQLSVSFLLLVDQMHEIASKIPSRIFQIASWFSLFLLQLIEKPLKNSQRSIKKTETRLSLVDAVLCLTWSFFLSNDFKFTFKETCDICSWTFNFIASAKPDLWTHKCLFFFQKIFFSSLL